MTFRTLRGISSVTAAVTGLLLIYGIVFAMEGMTTRTPESPLHELGITTLWILPWTILFCSGLDDLCRVTKRRWVFWSGVILELVFLFYFEYHTGDHTLTKGAMPLLATAAGLMPHVTQRISFMFTLLPLAAGIAGLSMSYWALTTFLSGSSFATKEIGFVILAFAAASLTSGVLTVTSLRRRHIQTI